MRISPLTTEDHWAWAELLATAFGRQPTDMVQLLTASGPDLAKLLQQWSAALWPQGVRIVHVLTSPPATLLRGLKETAVCLKMPYTRSPYYLTAKPLCSETPDTLFDFNLWGCTGGDIL